MYSRTKISYLISSFLIYHNFISYMCYVASNKTNTFNKNKREECWKRSWKNWRSLRQNTGMPGSVQLFQYCDRTLACQAPCSYSSTATEHWHARLRAVIPVLRQNTGMPVSVQLFQYCNRTLACQSPCSYSSNCRTLRKTNILLRGVNFEVLWL